MAPRGAGSAATHGVGTAVKNFLIIVIVALACAVAVLYQFREPLKESAYARLTADMFVTEDSDDFDPGPALGSSFPGLHAQYRGRRVSLLDDFRGRNGTVVVASRSLDWCPYCRRQMVQLQAHRSAFDRAGIGLLAITYDSPLALQAFAEQFAITIPLLSDIDALSFKTLGILNDQYQPGDGEYGIPHPGMIVVDRNGLVVGKLFIEAYSSRVDAASALAFARERLGVDDPTPP